MIRVKGLGERLYNLQNDPGGTNDLRLRQPQNFAMLKQNLLLWEKDKMAPLWTEGAMRDIITLMIHNDLMNNNKVRVHKPDQL